MRAKEFISEGRPSHRAEANHDFDMAHPGMIGPGGNGDTYWGRYYDFYRVSTLAGMDLEDLEKIDTLSFFGKLMDSMKKLGMKPKELIEKGSHESNGTNSASPIKSFKGYPR